MKTLEILSALRDLIAAIRLNVEGGSDELLFESVQLYPNKRLDEAVRTLILTKKRVCLIVPTGVQRDVSDKIGALSVLGRKSIEVAIVYSDVAYFKAEQRTAFGADNNLGLFAFDELIEDAICAKAISSFGGVVLGDSSPLILSDSAAKDAPGRTAWLIEAIVPAGIIAEAVL